MGVITFEHPLLILSGHTNLGQPNFDAELNSDVCDRTTHADLTVLLRVCFKQVNPSAGSNTYQDADGTAVPIRSWRAGEWDLWKRRFLSTCERHWNGRFWLRTPDAYRGLDWPATRPTHRPNLYCRLQLTEQLSEEGAHAVVPVVHVDGSHFFRSHALLYSNRDILPERLTRGSRFFTHIHEIGHLLGLPHPGEGRAGCSAGDEAACYAANPRSVMGLGSRVLKEHAAPWTKAIALITETAPHLWKVETRRAYPRSLP
jgi:hypothetical protein